MSNIVDFPGKQERRNGTPIYFTDLEMQLLQDAAQAEGKTLQEYLNERLQAISQQHKSMSNEELAAEVEVWAFHDKYGQDRPFLKTVK